VQLSEWELIGRPAYGYWWSFGDGATSSLQNPQHCYWSNSTYAVTLTVWDGAAAVVNKTNISVLPLNLSLAPDGSGSVTLSWPAWATNGSLYACTNLIPPANWCLVTNGVSSSGGVLSVTVPIGPGNRFFQLRSP
jgi:PKD repeat protein